MIRPTEDRLFERFRQRGDGAALAGAFDRTAPELARVARYLCRDFDAAEDAVQSTFLAAIESRASWDASRPLMPWLLGLLTNRVRLQRRWEARRPDLDRLAGAATVEDPVDAASRAELDACVRSAVAALDEPYRGTLERRLFGLRTAEQIASELGESAGTIRMRVHRGMDRLRRLLPADAAPGVVAVLPPLPAAALARVRDTVLAASEGVRASAAVGSVSIPFTGLLAAISMHKYVLVTAATVLAAVVSTFPFLGSDAGSGADHPILSRVEVNSAPRSPVAPLAATPPAERRAAAPTPTTSRGGRGTLEIVATSEGGPLIALGVEVRDGYGSAAAAAATDPAPPRPNAATASDGRLRCDVAAGFVRIRLAAAPDRAPIPIEVPAGAEVTATLEFSAQTIAKVRVVDAADHPLAGARIFGRTASSDLAMTPFGTTGADGRWRGSFAARWVQLRAAANGFAQSATAAVGGREITLRLERGAAAITGVVAGTDGRPLPGVEVVVVTATERDLAAQPTGVRTDDDGRYRIGNLPAGRVDVHAHRIDERSGDNELTWGSATLTTGTTSGLDLRFDRARGGSARVWLTDENGAAIPDQYLALVHHGRDVPTLIGALATGDGRTDADGHARLGGLLPGRHQLQFTRGGQRVTRDVDVVDGATVDIVVTLGPTSPVPFELLGTDGRPLSGHQVELTLPQGGIAQTAISDAEGRVRFEDVVHGEIIVRVTAPGAAFPMLKQPVTITDSSVQRLQAEPRGATTVTGIVRGGDDPPFEALRARLRSLRDAAVGEAELVAAGPSEARFTFSDVPPAEYLLEVVGPDGQPLGVRTGVLVRALSPLDLGTIVLGTGTARFELDRDDGGAVRAAFLLIRVGSAPLRRAGLPLLDGGIEVPASPAFAADEALIWGPDVAPEPVELVIAAGEHRTRDVVLHAATRVTVRVAANGDARREQRGTFDIVRDGTRLVREEVTLAAGEPYVRGLPRGSHRITFTTADGRQTATATVDVGATPIECRLELR